MAGYVDGGESWCPTPTRSALIGCQSVTLRAPHRPKDPKRIVAPIYFTGVGPWTRTHVLDILL